jgi:periplasmic divalent cation tolerance protein
MRVMETVLLVLTNVADATSAAAIARRLVEDRLSACVNQMPAVRSVYRWQDNIEEAEEMTLLIKTTAARYAEVEAVIKALHPYDLPEIIALPVAAGLPDYLAWVARETQKDMNV